MGWTAFGHKKCPWYGASISRIFCNVYVLLALRLWQNNISARYCKLNALLNAITWSPSSWSFNLRRKRQSLIVGFPVAEGFDLALFIVAGMCLIVLLVMRQFWTNEAAGFRGLRDDSPGGILHHMAKALVMMKELFLSLFGASLTLGTPLGTSWTLAHSASVTQVVYYLHTVRLKAAHLWLSPYLIMEIVNGQKR